MHDAGVADEDVHIPDFFKGRFHSLSVSHIAADGFGSGLGGHRSSGFLILFIQEHHPVSPGSKQLHRSRPNPPGTAGDNHILHNYTSGVQLLITNYEL